MAISIKQVRTSNNAPKSTPLAKAMAASAVGFSAISLRRKIGSGELIFFFTQLSLMMEIGTSLTGALRALEAQNRNPTFKEILKAMLHDIEGGRQLSDAMMRHPSVFARVYVSLVKAGETGGFLKNTLDNIVTMQERRQALITQLRSTLTYPAILCIIAVGVVGFVLIGILPKFMVLFAGKEQILPLTTRALMALSISIRGYWWVYAIGAGVLLFGGVALLRSPFGRAWLDLFFVRTPMVARLFNKIMTCQLLRTLGHLMESHVPLIEALDATHTTFKNRYFASFVDDISLHVREGGRLAEAFAANPYVMETVKQMVATGEEVGNLSKVMLRLAKFYDTEIERDLKIIASLVEPMALILLGAVVGLIVSSVILPIFRIASAVQ
jgi:type IV pilus assembly protein PilC